MRRNLSERVDASFNETFGITDAVRRGASVTLQKDSQTEEITEENPFTVM